MTDPNGNKVSVKDATLSMMAVSMTAGGMEQGEAEQKAAQKAKESHAWLMWAGLFVAIALAVVGVALYLVVHTVMTDKSFPVLVAIIFAAAAAVPLAVALFCATQASSEFISLYLGNLFKIGRAVRGKDAAP